MISLRVVRPPHFVRSLLVLCSAAVLGCGGAGSSVPLDDGDGGEGGDAGGGSTAVAPTGLTYPVDDATYTVGSAIAANVPTLDEGTGVAYSVLPGLPPGLAISAVTGTISGTPGEMRADADYTVTAMNELGSTTAVIAIEIVPLIIPLEYTLDVDGYVRGYPLVVEPSAFEEGASFAVVDGELPTGLSLDGQTGAIAGRLLRGEDPAPFTVEVTESTATRTSVVDFSAPRNAVARMAFAVHGAEGMLSAYWVDPSGRVRHRGALTATTGVDQLSVSPDGSVLMASNSATGEVHGWMMDGGDRQGSVAVMGGSPLDLSTLGASGSPSALAVHPTAQHVYAVDGDDLVRLSIDHDTGTLSGSSELIDTAAGSVGGVSIDPTGRFLYASGADDAIHGYSIDSASGELSALTPATFSAPGDAGALTHVNDGDFLVHCDEVAGTLTSFAVDDQGLLAHASTLDVVATLGGASPREVSVPVGGSRLDARLGDGTVVSFAVDPATGALTATTVSAITAAGGTTALATSPDGSGLLVLDSAGTSLGWHPVDSGDSVASAPSLGTASTGTEASRVAIAPGRRAPGATASALYTTAVFGSGLDQFSIAEGVPDALVPPTVETGVFPSALAAHPSLDWVYVGTGDAGADLQRFPVGPNGGLGAPESQNLPASLSALVLEPMGQRAFGLAGSALTVYSVDPGTGSLVAGESASAGLLPNWVAVHPSGRLFWVAPVFGASLTRIGFAPGAESLTTLGTSTPAGVGFPIDGALDPSGRYLFLLELSGDVSAFGVNQATGELTPVAGSPFSPLATPSGSATGLVSDPRGGSVIAAYGGTGFGSLVRFLIDEDPTNGTADGALLAEPAVAISDAPSRMLFGGGGEWLFVAEPNSGQVETVRVTPTAMTAGVASTPALSGLIGVLERAN